ncbi:DUF874 family protein [Helicobacter pylori]
MIEVCLLFAGCSVGDIDKNIEFEQESQKTEQEQQKTAQERQNVYFFFQA